MSETLNTSKDQKQSVGGRERRRRIRRPWTLKLFGVLFLALPIINYLGAAFAQGVSPRYYQIIFRSLNPIELAFLGLAVLTGIGLLMVKKWGWWLTLFFSGALSLYNLVVFFMTFSVYNLGALFMTIFGVTAIIYSTWKDISAPYMKMYPRGWRYQIRRPVSVSVRVNDLEFESRDMSRRGLFVNWVDCDLSPGDPVLINFELNGNAYDLAGGIVRMDEGGVGIAFRDVSADVEQALGEDLKKTPKTAGG